MTDISKINAEKAEIRRIYKEKRALLTDAECEKQDTELCRLITLSDEYRNARTVLLYCPMRKETDVMPIMKAALAEGKRVAFPRCEKERKMTFYYVTSDSEFELGSYGILEPKRELTAVSEDEYAESLCVVPGLVFDREGYRVGYGGGYYDRFLAKYTGYAIAPVREGFLYEGTLPRDGYDQRVMRLCRSEIRASHE